MLRKSSYLLLSLIAVACISSPAHADQYGDFTYTVTDSTVTITGYTGPGGDVVIPDTIDGMPVTTIASHAFFNCLTMTSVTIPASVTTMYKTFQCSDGWAPGGYVMFYGSFFNCPLLTAAYFEGNPPNAIQGSCVAMHSTLMGTWLFYGTASDFHIYYPNITVSSTTTTALVSTTTTTSIPASTHSFDFNCDGKADILWRHDTTGKLYVMLMDGFIITSQNYVWSDPDTAWKVAATGDFDADGKADLLLRNDATGAVYMQFMEGATITTSAYVQTTADTTWKIVASVDYNGDGKADILWRNDSTGQVYMMLMDGFSIFGQNCIYQEPDAAWQIIK